MSARRRCVVVDDDSDHLSRLSQALVRICPDIEVVGFRGGLQALEFVQRVHVDFVLTDFQMPILNGLQLASAIRDAGGKMPIILVSGNELGIDSANDTCSAILWKGALTSELGPTLDRLGIQRTTSGLGWLAAESAT